MRRKGGWRGNEGKMGQMGKWANDPIIQGDFLKFVDR